MFRLRNNLFERSCRWKRILLLLSLSLLHGCPHWGHLIAVRQDFERVVFRLLQISMLTERRRPRYRCCHHLVEQQYAWRSRIARSQLQSLLSLLLSAGPAIQSEQEHAVRYTLRRNPVSRQDSQDPNSPLLGGVVLSHSVSPAVHCQSQAEHPKRISVLQVLHPGYPADVVVSAELLIGNV